VKLYVGGRPTFFNVFSDFKKVTFYVFLSCCTRFLEHWSTCSGQVMPVQFMCCERAFGFSNRSSQSAGAEFILSRTACIPVSMLPCYRRSSVVSLCVCLLVATVCEAPTQWRVHAWGDGGDRRPPPRGPEEIFLNVSENKSSDRKLFFIFW